jgi:hypothetical protein
MEIPMEVPQKTENRLNMVAHAYDSSYVGGRDERTAESRSQQDLISTNNWTWWCVPVIPGAREA